MRLSLPSKLPLAKVSSLALLLAFSAPLLYYWAYCIWINPSNNFYTNDAEFPYFLNSLAVFKGGTYTYLDHPGTPLEEIGTAILGLTYPFASSASEGFILYHLENPDIFFNAARDFLIFFNLFCYLCFFGIARTSLGWNKTIGAATLAMMYFAIHPLALGATTIWNHNSFNFPFGTLLLLLLFRMLNQEAGQKEINKLALFGIGLFSGILASVTIYMAAWLIGILAAILVFYRLRPESWSGTIGALALTGGGSVAGFLLANLPILDRLIRFWNWIESILTHQSKYLAVPENESIITRLANNTAVFFHILPVLFISTLIVLGLFMLALSLWRKRLSERPGLWATAIGLGTQMIVLALIFLDRPVRGAYLLSLAATLPVLTMAVLLLWEYHPITGRILNLILSILVLIGILATSIQSVRAKNNEVETFADSQSQAQKTISDYAEATGRAPQTLTIFWMYGTYSKCWGLRTGNSFARNIFEKEVDTICPNQYYLGNNLRADIHGNSVPLSATNWDVIFSCDKYLDHFETSDPSITIKRYDQINWNCGSMVVILNNHTDPGYHP